MVSLIASFFFERFFCKYLCAAVCPVQGTLDIGLAKSTRISPSAAVALAAGTFFLAIFGLQALGFDRTGGMQEPSLRELVKSSGTTMEEFKNRYGLPKNLPAGTRTSKIEEAIPLVKMAEMSGTNATELKASLGLDPKLGDDTPWGVAYGLVSLAHIAKLNGTTFEEMKALFSLPDPLGPDSPWKDAKNLVEKAIGRMGENGEGGH